MQAIAHDLPPSYVFEGMRAAVAGKGVMTGDLVIGGGLAVVYVVGARAIFAAVYRYAIRTGLVARYSAETVS
jgi:ABC-2 type transport system permease protein